MKVFRNFYFIMLSVFFIFMISCTNDPCNETLCNNGGVCIEGICECPPGFSGSNCETMQTVDQRLSDGESPNAIWESNTSLLGEILGKQYMDGFIFYLSPNTNSFLIVDENDLPGDYSWGCFETDLSEFDNLETYPPIGISASVGQGKTNTEIILASGCIDGSLFQEIQNHKDGEWYLPSANELEEIFKVKDKIGNLEPLGYWSSTEFNGTYAWVQSFSAIEGKVGIPKNESLKVRFVKTIFE